MRTGDDGLDTQGVRTGHETCSPNTSRDLSAEGAVAECRPLPGSSPALPPDSWERVLPAQAFHEEGWADLSLDISLGAGKRAALPRVLPGHLWKLHSSESCGGEGKGVSLDAGVTLP